MEALEYEIMRNAEDRHWWYLGLHDLVLRYIGVEADCVQRSLKILDAGCGTGRLAQLMSGWGAVSACDVHPPAILATRDRGITEVFLADLCANGGALGSDSFDVITCMDVLYHRSIPDDLAALRNLHRALRPGGLLLIQVAAFESLRGGHDERVHTRHRYRRGELLSHLSAAGFRQCRASYRLFPMYLPLLLWRRGLASLLSGKTKKSDLTALPARFLNQLLTASVRVENRFLLRGVQLPFGTSVFASARK